MREIELSTPTLTGGVIDWLLPCPESETDSETASGRKGARQVAERVGKVCRREVVAKLFRLSIGEFDCEAPPQWGGLWVRNNRVCNARLIVINNLNKVVAFNHVTRRNSSAICVLGPGCRDNACK